MAKTAIFCFARMNPPHIGHGKLITSMFAIQRSIHNKNENADIYIYLQGKSDGEKSKSKRKPGERKDPLVFEDKQRFVEQYIEYSLQDPGKKDTWFIESEFTAQNAFDKMKEKGYTRFYFFMGADRRDAFSSPDFKTTAYTPMYEHIKNKDIKWTESNGIPTGDSDFIKKQRIFYQTEERDGDRKHEIHLNNFEKDYLLSSYEDMDFPLIEDNTVLAVINPRVIHRYHLNIDGDEIERDPKSVSATEVRALINNYVFSFTKEQYDAAKSPQEKVKFYADEYKKATFKDILDFLLRQGYFGKTSTDEQKALIMDMIVEIKFSLSGDLNKSFGYIDSTAEARRSRRESMDKKTQSKGSQIPDINVLSYNVCWECSEPKKDRFNKNINYYEPDIKAGWYKEEEKRNATIKKYEGDDDRGIEHMCNEDVQRCRRNIGSIIEKGYEGANGQYEPYDLVGMQEYIPHHDARWLYDEHFALVTSAVILPMGDIEKPVLIGSLYNKNRFELINQIGGEFLITKTHWKTGDVIAENAKDGRPFLILHLEEINTGNEILFINAHMPQTRNIPPIKDTEGRGGDMYRKKAEAICKPINDKIEEMMDGIDTSMFNPSMFNPRIILTSDTNDIKHFNEVTGKGVQNFINYLNIFGKKLHYGDKYEKTCCTSVVKPINKKGRKERRIRYGDVILDSGSENESFTYHYPEETKSKDKNGDLTVEEPYSDHLPIATKLKGTPVVVNQGKTNVVLPSTPAIQPVPHNPHEQLGGRKKRTRRRKRKRTRRKKKRKRRRTKKKRKKRRKRKRTKRR